MGKVARAGGEVGLTWGITAITLVRLLVYVLYIFYVKNARNAPSLKYSAVTENVPTAELAQLASS